MDKKNFRRVSNRQGRTFTFEDKVTYIERQEITVQSGAIFYNGPSPEVEDSKITHEPTLSPQPVNADVTASKEHDDIVSKLQPIFFGDREKASEFVSKIKGLRDTSICSIVKELVEQRVISSQSSRKDLWQVLHDHGLYSATLRNWNIHLS